MRRFALVFGLLWGMGICGPVCAYAMEYPVYTTGTPAADTDEDGIGDAWETTHGLDATTPTDSATVTADGYSNLEHFLNELAGDGDERRPLPPTNLQVLSPTEQAAAVGEP